MKKCPFCAEEIQNDAVYCRHCKNHLDDAPTVSRKESKGKLKEFETFMASYGGGWVLISKSNEMTSYQKVTTGSKGSCLVALILFCLGIIPGILYLWFANQQGGTYHLTVTLNPNGDLMPSGDSSGMSVFNSFLKSKENPGKIITAPVKPWYFEWWAILMWIIVIWMMISLISVVFKYATYPSSDVSKKEVKVLWDIPQLMNKSHNQIASILGTPTMTQINTPDYYERYKMVDGKKVSIIRKNFPVRVERPTSYDIFYKKTDCEFIVCGTDLSYSYIDADQPIKYFFIDNFPTEKPKYTIDQLKSIGNLLNNNDIKIIPALLADKSGYSGIDICAKGYNGSEYEDGSENCLN
jgi:hypothetical protein